MNSKIHIIAEAGTNHNGRLDKAMNLAKIAKIADANSVKYQIIYPEGLYLPGNYEYGHYDIKEVIRIRKDGMLSDQAYHELANYCKQIGISFTASVFDKQGLDLLDKFDPPFIKTASCDLNNVRFLKQVADKGRKIIISTGMASLSDIEYSLNELAKTNFTDYVLLHCVSVYPAAINQTNLSFLDVLKSNFDCEIGFSDHTESSIAACIALAKGATWFEKHFTEDKSQNGFDHAYAMEKKDLIDYVKDLKAAEISLTVKDEKLSEAELYTRKRARRSLYAARDISIGDIIKNEDILVLRPEGMMHANEVDLLVGKKIKSSIKQYQPFNYNMIL